MFDLNDFIIIAYSTADQAWVFVALGALGNTRVTNLKFGHRDKAEEFLRLEVARQHSEVVQ